MLTHDKIMQKMILQVPTDNGLAVIDFKDGERIENQLIVFTSESVKPEFFNLLSASVVMYQTLAKASEVLNESCEVCKANGAQDALKSFQELANVINFSMLIATDGISVIANKLDEKELN